MANKITYVLVALMAVFLVYEFLTIMNSQYYQSNSITQNMTGGTNYTFTPIGAGLYSVTSLHNSTTTCTLNDDYTYNATVFTLRAAGTCIPLESLFTMDYKYKAKTTIMGIDFGFIVIMSLLVIIVYVMAQLQVHKK